MIDINIWINETRETRTKHLDLMSECLERGGNSTVHRGVLAQYLNTNMPAKIHLCHACNNGKCSNPKHLYWGTSSENSIDALNCGARISIYQALINKHGIDEAKNILFKNASKGWSRGGKANKGKPKTEEHKRKLSESNKKTYLEKCARGEIG